MASSRSVSDRARVLDLEEAQRLLPLVRTVAARINRRQALRRRLEGEAAVLQVISDTASPSGIEFQEFLAKSLRYHRLAGRIDALVDHLTELGCVVRDRDATWVDFVCLRADGLAVFCWHKDEARISHWHRLHEPHAARRRLGWRAN